MRPTDKFDQISANFQNLGMSAIRKLFEESEFVKMMIGIQRLAQYFYNYSLSISKKETNLMMFIIDSLENP